MQIKSILAALSLFLWVEDLPCDDKWKGILVLCNARLSVWNLLYILLEEVLYLA